MRRASTSISVMMSALSPRAMESVPSHVSPPAVLHREDSRWQWLPRSVQAAPDGSSLVTVVSCPTGPALTWALPWGALPGPLTVEQTEEQAANQIAQHRQLEEELGTRVEGYASHVLGALRRNSKFLHLTELPDKVSSKVWEAALLLRERLLTHRRWEQVSVLELGSGVGLVGLELAAAGANVVVTDMGEGMPVLEANTQRNVEVAASVAGTAVAVELDWLWDEEKQKAAVPLKSFDVVVGADIVYEIDCILPLLHTFMRFGREFWLVQNINRAGSQIFLQHAEKLGLSVHREPLDYEPYELWRLSQPDHAEL